MFLVGQTRNSRLDELLEKEANYYRDIIFGNFIDSYRNLTRKMVLGIEWASKHCQAKYLMKADEDSFVNILDLIKWLEEYHRMPRRSNYLFMGAAIIGSHPYRERDSQFFVSEKEYPESTYPPYASGSGYVFSGKLLKKLSKALKLVKLFSNEDVCFGLLMWHIGVNLINNDKFIPFTKKKAIYTNRRGYSLCKFNGPIVIHRISGKLQIQTHFNVLIVRHAPTICDHVKSGIGETDNFVDTDSSYLFD